MIIAQRGGAVNNWRCKFYAERPLALPPHYAATNAISAALPSSRNYEKTRQYGKTIALHYKKSTNKSFAHIENKKEKKIKILALFQLSDKLL